MPDFVSRAGQKLDHALAAFGVDAAGLVCADLGSNAGGFVDCLLRRGAAKVYAVEKGYGVLEWKLRKDPRVVVMERTNAMHATLPERVDLVTIDVAWTRQRHNLPPAGQHLKHTPTGVESSLSKPHYEADPKLLKKGILPPESLEPVLAAVKQDIHSAGFHLEQLTPSPIPGGQGNTEFLALLRPKEVNPRMDANERQ
jgi:23S rRNA (cytidine1920-2'-O)/16S rRNA (cytidine1409-2'-O)-methyltransferase